MPDHETFQRCRDLGFTYFEGEYFAQPRLFRRQSVATAGLGSLRRLAELTAGDVSFEDLEQIIASDVGLSLKLLRYVNSAFFALPRTVGSVREALTLLGVRTVRRWAVVMAISSLPDVHDELVSLALRRARMCEVLAGSALPEEKRDALHRSASSPSPTPCSTPRWPRCSARCRSPRRSRPRCCAARVPRASSCPPSSPTSAASSPPSRPRRLARERLPRGPRVGRGRGPGRRRVAPPRDVRRLSSGYACA